jgi:hypothetical protein
MSAHTPVCSGILLRTYKVLRLGVFHVTSFTFRRVRRITKAAVSFFKFFCLPVCPYVRTKQLASYWKNFHENSYLRISRISVEKIQVLIKSDKNNGYFTWRLTHICDISLNSAYNEKCFIQNIVEKLKTYVLCSIISPIPSPHHHEDPAVYEIMCKNMVEPDRPQMTKRRMRFAFWITKTKNTHSE